MWWGWTGKCALSSTFSDRLLTPRYVEENCHWSVVSAAIGLLGLHYSQQTHLLEIIFFLIAQLKAPVYVYMSLSELIHTQSCTFSICLLNVLLLLILVFPTITIHKWNLMHSHIYYRWTLAASWFVWTGRWCVSALCVGVTVIWEQINDTFFSNFYLIISMIVLSYAILSKWCWVVNIKAANT